MMSRKTEQVFTVNERAKTLFQAIYYDQVKTEKKSDEEAPKINVSDLVSKMSFYYEKIRNTLEYKEEHLFRKNAIERILKRQIVIEGVIREVNAVDVSRVLLTELIRGGYLPNNSIPEMKIGEIAQVLEKYVKLRKYCEKNIKTELQDKLELVGWIISLAASDMEEKLGRGQVDKTVIMNMYEILSSLIELPADSPYGEDKDIQIYLGIHRSLMKFDPNMLSFIAFKYYVENWNSADDAKIIEVGANILSLRKAVMEQIEHPLASRLGRIISRYTVYFSILTDVVRKDPVGVYESIKFDPIAFPREIKIKCEERYQKSKSKLWRAAIRSIIYIFITKSIFAFILEFPVSNWLGEEVNPFALVMNICFPPLLLFLIVLFTKLPSDDNTKKIVEGIEEVVFEEKKRTEPIKLSSPGAKRSAFSSLTFGILYAITFFVSFGAVIWTLDVIGFSIISSTIFIFFLALVSFFSIRIRRGTKDLLVVSPKESIFSLFSDFFYTPIIVAGKWLSEKFSRINVFVFIFDFIIEAPFKIFVEVTEQWTKYVRERKDQIG